MHTLFVNCCPRGEASRTLGLANAFLADLYGAMPEMKLVEQNPYEMNLAPVWGDTLALRERLCDARNWSHSLTASAAALVQADLLVIAAPYWDLSFPSALKVWMEHMWIRNLSFYYENDKPVGLCRAKEAVYITTAGSYMNGHDWGTLYVEDCLRTLGVKHFTAITAEALDLDSGDPTSILEHASEEAHRLAASIIDIFR